MEMVEELKRDPTKELEKALVAVSTVVLIAGLKKHALAALFEQWRALTFLLLNLLLLSILFTSLHSKSNKLEEENNENNNNNKDQMNEEKKREKPCSWSEPIEKLDEEEEEEEKEDDYSNEDTVCAKVDNEEYEAAAGLSKEELNERVEAFIIMFRQHLARDAQGKSAGFRQMDHRKLTSMEVSAAV